MYSVRKKTTSMYTRDGVKLDADIYSPESSEKFPVLLMRQPYGRAIAQWRVSGWLKKRAMFWGLPITSSVNRQP